VAGESAFKVEGRVVEVLSAKTFRVELVNGHRLLGFIAGKAAKVELAPGDRVKLELSPYDLSEGRIVGRKETPG
jgi:translation initiation factor IF-1